MEERHLEHLVHINVTFRIKGDAATQKPKRPLEWTITVSDPNDHDDIKRVLIHDPRLRNRGVSKSHLVIERVDVLK